MERIEKAVDMSGYESLGPLHEMFRRQAAKTPQKIAIVAHDGSQVTFQELDEMTDLLSMYLRCLGVKTGSNVGIYMERCVNYVIAYIAILKAGGAYMPLDVSYPVTLLEDILTDAQPVAICVQPDMYPNLKGFENTVAMDDDWLSRIRVEMQTRKPPRPGAKPTLDDLAYTVYSSGTTGKPKGIQCPHRGAVFSYHWRHLAYPYAEDEREAANVFFTWEMLRPLLQGVPLYIIPDSVIYDPRLLCDFIRNHAITRMLFTPSLLEAVLDSEKERVSNAMSSLRTIIFCGEVVTLGLLERCLKVLPNARFVNLYSISEAHDIACSDLSVWYKGIQDTRNKKFCPVGKLLPGAHIVILDSNLNPQPVGVPGEIYVGGPTLAHGYLNRPELNKSRFIARPDGVPASVGDRLYKAGDWGYMLSDGSFEICGRCDSMVKVRGYSVETQVIEAALLELPFVKACVVLVMGEEGEDKYLVAYIVLVSTVTKKEVRAALKKRLPFYMIPSYFIFLNSIPILTSSGKLDKKALPAVDKSEAVDVEGLATTPTEKALVPMWADVLQISSVDIQESFFDLGGHSLLATKLLNKVRENFGVELTVRDLFTYSTVSMMAKLIDSKLKGNGGSEEQVVSVDLLKEVDRHDQVTLSMDIQLRAFWRSMQYGERWKTGRVLLTGATGFLGAFLLRDLLLHTQTHIYCLVRELPDQKAMTRIEMTLQEYGMIAHHGAPPNSDQERLEYLVKTRVTPVKGDVGLVRMGLEEEDYLYMCTDIDFVIHAAAYVNLIYPYKALHGPNVLGTQNVLLFACTSKIKPLHYISTDAVFPHALVDAAETHDMLTSAHKLTDGYSQSKWVAEQLVLRAIERGLPAIIYRLGNQAGDSVNGYWNAQDLTLLILQGCLYSHTAPVLSWDVEFTPVDFVSKLVVTLTQHMALGLGKALNVVNTQPIGSQWLFEWISSHGYPLKMLPYTEWRESISKVSAQFKECAMLQRILFTLIEDETYFSSLTKYKNEELQKILKTLGLSYPEIDHQLLGTYFQALAKRAVIPRVRRNTTVNQSLQEKVAIVTGASSGIGAAISRALAGAGARVAMAARREDKLEQQRKKIVKDYGGVAICVRCDVTDRNSVAEMVMHVEKTLGPVDILVNNAGVMYYTMMKNLQEDQWNQQIDINCKGVVNCVAAVLDSMVKRGEGHIINMSSDAGRRGFAGLAVYSGTKFFVEGLSQGMRHEFSGLGIKVTCVQPGDVKTELLSHTTDMEAKAAFDGSQETRILDADDVARAVLFAASQPSHVGINEILIEPRGAPI